LLGELSELLDLSSGLLAVLAEQRRDIADEVCALEAHRDEALANSGSLACRSAHFLHKQDHVFQLAELSAVDVPHKLRTAEK